MKSHHRASLRNSLVTFQALGDAIFCFVGLAVALWLRFFTSLRHYGFVAPDDAGRSFVDYLPLLCLGTVLLVGTFFYLQLYDPRLLLRRHRSLSVIIKGIFFWFCVFLGTSLALKFEPTVSRLFVLLSCATAFALLAMWRLLFHLWVTHSSHRDELVQRVAIVGWSPDAAQLVTAITNDHGHPYHVLGLISINDVQPETNTALPFLGRLEDLDESLTRESVDILVVGDPYLSREELLGIATLCERRYISFKIIPSFFQIFVSNLHLQTIAGVSLLGVEGLPLDRITSRGLKRAVDTWGALVGLMLSVPVIVVLALLIRRESPGPIFFSQERIGRRGRPFRMWKLRSMVVDAHLKDSESQSTLRNDPRMTRIGSFMRRNNLDELPQFFNVLIGDMSLVGPRPERSYHVQQLSVEIPHYNPRHAVKPGMTGWAQVNGLRGDTSLAERVRYDLYYIENWSVFFDLQILLLTFVRVRNAY